MESTDKALAKNTVYLYLRMGIGTIISLYTSRLVLEQLGIDGYGVYTVVGAVVVSLGFLSNSLSGAVARFFAFELGRDNTGKMRLIFNTALRIELVVGLFLLVILLTGGDWFIRNFLSIPPEDCYAARIVLIASAGAFFFTVITVPYKSAVIAREQFGTFALIELLVVVLKLLVVMTLQYALSDKLIIYSVMIGAVLVLGDLSYCIYGRFKLPECRLSRKIPHSEYRPLLSYAGVDLFGHFCGVISPQSVQWIANVFSGIIVNAAIGVTNQVTAAVSSFVTAVSQAFRPRIIKAFSAGNIGKVESLTVSCSRFAILLMGCLVIPMSVNLDFILHLWLKDVPEKTVLLCSVALYGCIPFSLVNVGNAAVHATGRIKWLSFVNGLLFLLIPALSYLFLFAGYDTVIIFVIALIAYTLQWLNSIKLAADYITGFSMKRIIVPCLNPLLVLIIDFILCYGLSVAIDDKWANLLCSIVISLVICGTYALNIFLRFKNDE